MKKGQLALVVLGMIVGLAIFMAPHLPEKSAEEVKQSTLDQKINKAIQFVNSGEQPMQGIMLLREVLEEDPNNVRAHFQLGIFSITSGQYNKAIERFEKVKSLDSTVVEADYYLGHAYANLGNRQMAKSMFISFQQNTEDAEKKKEVQQYINELN